MKKTIFAAVVALMVSAPAIGQETGPFGTRMGMSRAELVTALGIKSDSEVVINDNAIVTRLAITPSGFFKTYRYVFTEETGLCQVTAWSGSTTHEDSVKLAFDRVSEQLTKRYGPTPSARDFVVPGYESLGLFQAVSAKRRFLFAGWEVGDKTQDKHLVDSLPNNLRTILLKVDTNGVRGELDLTYIYANGTRCVDLINASKATGL